MALWEVAAIALGGSTLAATALLRQTNSDKHASDGIVQSISECVGNTPLLELKSLSEATGCRVLAKCEHLNPGGSIKDRTALALIQQGLSSGQLKPGSTIVEGTGGNTGIALAMFANALGFRTLFTMPDRISKDKIHVMKLLGAGVHLQPSVSFSDPRHFYHKARELGQAPGSFCPNQFENLANMRVHYNTTAPEIWRQTQGALDAFVCASGTGGTIAGCSRFFKEKKPNMKVYLIDPPGSGLYSYITERTFKSDGGSTITEGIGSGRATSNFASAMIDGAMHGTDQEAVAMANYLIHHEGILVGPSAAMNVVGAVKVAQELGPGHTVVTVICDSGEKYLHTTFSEEWLKKKGLAQPTVGRRGDISFVKPSQDLRLNVDKTTKLTA